MSTEEIKQARQQILDQIGGHHPKALEKLKNLKPKQKISQKAVLETSEVSSAVKEIASSIESEHIELQHFGVSLSGTPERIKMPEDTENAKFLSYITNENFDNLDSHIFSLSEI